MNQWIASRLIVFLIASIALGTASARETREAADPRSPAQIFGPLYAQVELAHLFPDSKSFADAVPLRPAAQIMAEYHRLRPATGPALKRFVASRFRLPASPGVGEPEPVPAAASLLEHIRQLWPRLARPPLQVSDHSSQLPLPYPFVVPGGRFREIYYWDSYFTMLGLMQDGESALARGLVANFADLIQRYGHIPNGSRTYYLSRSQPPVFYLMAGLGAADPSEGYAAQLAALRAEYAFWMRGAQGLRPGAAREHVVRMPDGELLNRYRDALDTPRDESYAEDAALAARARRPKAELYRELRSAAESGWDFSSRWQRDPKDLASIEITAIIPVDLNSLLYGLERAISDGCARQWDAPCAREFHERAEHRHRAIDRYLWDPARHRYSDYQWRRRLRLDRPSAAMLYPLFVGIADDSQAREVAATVKALLLARGGLLATPVRTGQQWDSPNGWAPLQWIAVRGLSEAHEDELAKDIAQRWLATVSRVYHATGKLLEKYDVVESLPGGGGEYPTQDGFGWTNGVTRALMARYPDVGQPMQVSE